MVAVARRAGIPLTIDRFDELAQRTPLIANIRPAGEFLMEDFFYAGGCARCSRRSATARARRAHRQRPHARREHRRREVYNRRRDPAARQARWFARAASRCCAAISRPNGAVIKPPRRRRIC
jgi:hypothetical protein